MTYWAPSYSWKYSPICALRIWKNERVFVSRWISANRTNFYVNNHFDMFLRDISFMCSSISSVQQNSVVRLSPPFLKRTRREGRTCWMHQSDWPGVLDDARRAIRPVPRRFRPNRWSPLGSRRVYAERLDQRDILRKANEATEWLVKLKEGRLSLRRGIIHVVTGIVSVFLSHVKNFCCWRFDSPFPRSFM